MKPKKQFAKGSKLFAANMASPKIRQILDHTYDTVRLLSNLLYLPGNLEETYIRGLEHFPSAQEKSPVIAVSHKKFHDVYALMVALVARPASHFHHITAIAQAGLFSGLYPYRDLIPDFLKLQPFRTFSVASARMAGSFIHALFNSINAFPVFRPGVDIPINEEHYASKDFPGKLLYDRNFADFVRYANATTLKSVAAIQKLIDQRNYALVIAPEGKYQHSGEIQQNLELMAIIALRKQRPIVHISLSYDELCPDLFNRCNAWLEVAPALDPPASRKDIKDLLIKSRYLLQQNTVITMSHLIATAIKAVGYQVAGNVIRKQQLQNMIEQYLGFLQNQPVVMDPGLSDPYYRNKMLYRFWDSFGRKWFFCQGNRYFFNRREMEKFDNHERTVNDIEWNCNNICHVSNTLLRMHGHPGNASRP